MITANFETLRQSVIDSSVGSSWSTAVLEWEVTSIEEDPASSGVCVCGQTGLLWLFTITNERNDSELFPIGSSCVNHFERADLNRQIEVLGALVHLRTAIRDNEQITLTTDYFSRAVLEYLYDEDVFTPDQYNGGDGWNDYEFLRKMFGKRDKDSINNKQRYKIRMLLDRKVNPFVLNSNRLG